MTLAAGARLGPYEILAPLGEGGMGVVYRARDARLGREVAIKILAAGAVVDPDRLVRFEQEARAAAALNHPNIVALHDVGTYEGSPYLVVELLDGKTLRDRMADGPLPVRRAADYARQMALGLAAAHEKGIVHRDIKPENVFVTADDRVKILDFGLAKLTELDPAAANATMPDAPLATMPGMVMGTAGYMAPEQARGLATDWRADVFAFGAVVYEMLSGRRAFAGPTVMDTMMAVAREDPPSLAALRPDLPAALVRVVERCLEKDPAARFQSTRDLAFALEGAVATPSGGSPTVHEQAAARPAGRWRPWPWAVAGVAAGAILAASIGVLRPRTPDAPSRPLAFTLPSDFDNFRLPGVSPAASGHWNPSPDNRWLLGLELLQDGRTRFVLHELATGTSRGLEAGGKASPFAATPATESFARFSPDAAMVAYVSDTSGPPEVYVQGFPAAGPSRQVSVSGGTLPKWSRDGARVYFLSPDGWIMEAPIARSRGEIAVGAPVRVARGSANDFMPSADGQRFLLMEVEGRRPTALVNWQSLVRR